MTDQRDELLRLCDEILRNSGTWPGCVPALKVNHIAGALKSILTRPEAQSEATCYNCGGVIGGDGPDRCIESRGCREPSAPREEQ